MSWMLGLYIWGVVVSGVVNTTKSLLALWYAKTEDTNYYNKFKEKSSFEKTMFFVGNILKMFIPIYNIIHPVKLILDSHLPNLLHPIRSLKDSGRRQLAIWSYKEARRESIKNSIKNRFKKIKNFFSKAKDEVKVEKEKMTQKIQNKKEKELPKKEETTSKGEVKLPPRKSVSEQKDDTIKEINIKISELKREYIKLKKQYDVLKENGSSVLERNKVASRINKICEDTKSLIARRDELKNKPVVNTTRENSINKPTITVDVIDGELATLYKEQRTLCSKYMKLVDSGTKSPLINELSAKIAQVDKKIKYIENYRKSLINSDEPTYGGCKTLRR